MQREMGGTEGKEGTSDSLILKGAAGSGRCHYDVSVSFGEADGTLHPRPLLSGPQFPWQKTGIIILTCPWCSPGSYR